MEMRFSEAIWSEFACKRVEIEDRFKNEEERSR